MIRVLGSSLPAPDELLAELVLAHDTGRPFAAVSDGSELRIVLGDPGDGVSVAEVAGTQFAAIGVPA